MNTKSACIGAFFLLNALPAFAGTKAAPRVSVTRFRQEAEHIFDHCHGWDFTTQNQLQTELERDLAQEGLKVLERRDIRKVYYNEYELPNSDRKSIPKRGGFLSAQYTITGGITELGVCEQSSGSAVQLGGLVSLLGGPSGADIGVGKRDSVSRVKVVAQVVSVRTGAILKSFEANSEIKDHGYSLSGGAMGIGASHHAMRQPPIEKATNQAIQKLGTQIAEYLQQRR